LRLQKSHSEFAVEITKIAGALRALDPAVEPFG
jgi:hypothetical protein